MIATLREVKEKILRLLNDEPMLIMDSGDSGDTSITGGTTYDSNLVNDAVCAALDAVAFRLWKTNFVDIEEAGSEFSDLPDDVMEILSVFDNNLGAYIPRQQMIPGKTIVNSEYGNSWLDPAPGVITFGAPLTEKGARIFYMAPWVIPEDETDSIESPDSTQNAIIFYACSYCLLQQASGISTIRQYNTRVDSGQPTDNPTKEMANYFLRRFDIELQRLPLKTREQLQ